MKEYWDLIIRNMPEPFIIALILAGIAFFSIYYSRSYTSYSDAFNDRTFRSLAIVIGSITLLYVNNRQPSAPSNPEAAPALIVPLFENDEKGQCRAQFAASIESKLDEALGRSKTVLELPSFIKDELTATSTAAYYRAAVVMYDPTVSLQRDDKIICLHLLQAGSGPLPRVPPIPLGKIDDHIDTIVSTLIGGIAKTEAEFNKNPLLRRTNDLEKRLNELATVVSRLQPVSAAEKLRPVYRKRFALLVGSDKFKNIPIKFSYMESDATQLADVLKSRYNFQEENLSLLLGSDSTKPNIVRVIRSVAQSAKSDDMFVFYYSGHCTSIPTPMVGSAVVASSIILYDDFEFETGTFSTSELREEIQKIPSRHKLVIFYACNAASGWGGEGALTTRLGEANQPVLEFLASCRANQLSYEGQKWGGGVFTQVLVRSLVDAANGPSQGIWMSDLFDRININMKIANVNQYPVLYRVAGSGEIYWDAAFGKGR